MTPRDYIGKTFEVKRADELRLGDKVLVHMIGDGLFHAHEVRTLALEGDDVIVNEGNVFYTSWETSQGNAVLVESR